MLLALCLLWHILFAVSILPNLLLLYLIIKKSALMVSFPLVPLKKTIKNWYSRQEGPIIFS